MANFCTIKKFLGSAPAALPLLIPDGRQQSDITRFQAGRECPVTLLTSHRLNRQMSVPYQTAPSTTAS